MPLWQNQQMTSFSREHVPRPTLETIVSFKTWFNYSWSIPPEDSLFCTFHTVTACCHNFQLMPLLLTIHDHNLHKFAYYNNYGCSLRLTPVSYVTTCIDMKGNLIMQTHAIINNHKSTHFA